MMPIVQVKRRGGSDGDYGMRVGVKAPEDHAFTLPLFTCKLDELTPEESPVLLSQTSVLSVVQPVLFPTPGSFLWKQSYNFHPWFAFTNFLIPEKKKRKNLWPTSSVTINQCMGLCLPLSKKPCQFCRNVCFCNLEKQLDQTAVIYELITIW